MLLFISNIVLVLQATATPNYFFKKYLLGKVIYYLRAKYSSQRLASSQFAQAGRAVEASWLWFHQHMHR